jgi:cation transport ATPase
MSKILAKLFGSAGSGIADKISGIIDKHTFSKEEKAQIKKEMDQIWIEAEAEMQKNVTERWKVDMSSDSWLSKNVRPLVLIFLVVSTVLMVFIDAGVISFEVKANWIDLLQLVLITVIGAYFGGRSAEKFKK